MTGLSCRARARAAVVAALAVTALAVTGLAACGPASHRRSTAVTSSALVAGVTLGFLGPLSGPDAALGRDVENGAKLAVSQYMTTAPKVKVTLVAIDSGGRPPRAGAAAGAKRLVAARVVGVIGPVLSAGSLAAAPVFERAGIPSISPSATAAGLAGHGWTHSHWLVAGDGAQGRDDADYLVQSLGDSAVAVIEDGSAHGSAVAAAVRSEVRADGGTVVLSSQVGPGEKAGALAVEGILAAKEDAVFFGGSLVAGIPVAVGLRQAGYSGAVLYGGASAAPALLIGRDVPSGVTVSCACEDTLDESRAEPFVAAYQAQFGSPPQPYSAESYDATNFFLAAIQAAATTPRAVDAYLGSHTYQGITKVVKFASDGDLAAAAVYLYHVQNGKVVQVGTAG